ncbi:MAG: hypothetical protein AABY22_20965, partial [Nanoarchaeota archaeon]
TGTGAPPPQLTIAQIIAMAANYMAESFPLKVGMRGNKVGQMQTALRTKFNELAVASDNWYGIKTYQALKRQKYLTGIQTAVSESDFNNILLGVRKT